MHPILARRHLAMAVAAASALFPLAVTRPAAAAEVQVTPATFASAFAAAAPGDTIVLAGGSYGTFNGAQKPGMVTIRPAAGAVASMRVNFNPATNITLDGLKITGAEIADSRTSNITIRNSTFDGAQVVMRTGQLQNANILFDANVHSNINVCSGCYDGRITLPQRVEGAPSGITIQNSLFVGGSMDGILNGSNGTRIINNEFADLRQTDGADGAHTDAIQLYGSKNTLIKGNYFHGVAAPIMAPDGAENEVIEDNVMAGDGGSPFRIQLGADRGSVIRHNTLQDGACDWNARCGKISLGGKDTFKGSGTVIKDNVLHSISMQGSAPALGYNLLIGTEGLTSTDLRGTPSFVGGMSPASYGGFALTAGSLGDGSASDGLDRGARFSAQAPAPVPSPEPTPTATPTPTPTATPTPTPTPTATPTPTPTATPTPTPTATPTPTPTATPAPAPVTAPVTAGPNGLVAAYSFEESSGIVANDSSGLGNYGWVAGPARTTSGRFGRALTFDGVDDFVVAADAPSLDLTTGMTLEAWVYPTTGGATWRQAVLKERPAGLSYALYAYDDKGRSSAYANIGQDRGVASSGGLPTFKWSHIAATYDGAAMRFYVNGKLVGQRTQTGAMVTSDSPLKLGGNAIWSEWFKGRMDEVRVYNLALTADQVKSDMNAKTPATFAASTGSAQAKSKKPRGCRASTRGVRRESARRRATVRCRKAHRP